MNAVRTDVTNNRDDRDDRGHRDDRDDRDNWTNESVAAPRNRLKKPPIGSEREANLPDRVVDPHVVIDDDVGPEPRADVVARDQRVSALDEQHQQLERLFLQRYRSPLARQGSAPRVEDVCAESES